MTNKKSFWIMAIIDIFALLFVVFAKDIIFLMAEFLPICPLAKLGYQCPACGGTRCVFSLLNLNFVKAFKFNPFIFFLIFYCLIIFVCLNLHFLFGFEKPKKIYTAMLNPKIPVIYCILFVVFGIVRNFI